MTDVSNGEKTRFPQPVDDTWGRVALPWGRRCESVRPVTEAWTGRVRSLSTEVRESRWKTRGQHRGRSGESSVRGPTVDAGDPLDAGCPLVVHRPVPPTSSENPSYPQSSQHLRRRLVISTQKTKTTTELWMWATAVTADDMAGASGPGRSESEPSSQEGSHEVSG